MGRSVAVSTYRFLSAMGVFHYWRRISQLASRTLQCAMSVSFYSAFRKLDTNYGCCAIRCDVWLQTESVCIRMSEGFVYFVNCWEDVCSF